MTDKEEIDVVNFYHELTSSSIDEVGVYPQNLLFIDKNDEMSLMALALTPPQCFAAMVGSFRKEPKKLIMGIDRTCLPNQGTTLGDCVAGFYWNGEKWATFVIEYQHEPRVVKPIQWDNQWWNDALKKELKSYGFEV